MTIELSYSQRVSTPETGNGDGLPWLSATERLREESTQRVAMHPAEIPGSGVRLSNARWPRNGVVAQSGDSLTIMGRFTVSEEDAGRPVEMVVVAWYEDAWLFACQQGRWVNWDGNWTGLPTASTLQLAAGVVDVPLVEGTLPTGHYQVYFGYRVRDDSGALPEWRMCMYGPIRFMVK